MANPQTCPFQTFFKLPLRNGLTRPKAVRGEGTKMINMGEIFAHGRIGDIEMDRVNVSDREAASFLLEPGDLLFARQSLVLEGAGKCSIFLGAKEPATFESHIIRARLDSKLADPSFFYYFFNSPAGRSTITSIVEQVAAAGIRGSDLARLEVANVPREQQGVIARILGTLDDKIELNRRMNETLEAMARAIFKSWFIDFDPVRRNIVRRTGQTQPSPAASRYPLPVGEGQGEGSVEELDRLFPDRFEDSELGEIPEGWEVGSLANFASLNSETWLKETRPDIINYVDLSNTKWGCIEAVTAYPRQNAPSRAQRILRPGDTVVGTVRPGNGSYAFISEDGLTGSTGFAVLRPRRAEHPAFVYLAATAADNIEALAHLADGAAYPAVRPEVVIGTQAVRAGDNVLGRFAQVANPLLGKMAENERESRTLAALRDALLPKLISGELRVKHRDEPLAEDRYGVQG